MTWLNSGKLRVSTQGYGPLRISWSAVVASGKHWTLNRLHAGDSYPHLGQIWGKIHIVAKHTLRVTGPEMASNKINRHRSVARARPMAFSAGRQTHPHWCLAYGARLGQSWSAMDKRHIDHVARAIRDELARGGLALTPSRLKTVTEAATRANLDWFASIVRDAMSDRQGPA